MYIGVKFSPAILRRATRPTSTPKMTHIAQSLSDTVTWENNRIAFSSLPVLPEVPLTIF